MWIIVAIIITVVLLGIMGIVVEYSRIGTNSYSVEDAGLSRFNMPMLQSSSTQAQFKHIMLIKDELLKNSKNLWASCVLCFSFTRNIRQLFQNLDTKNEKMRHKHPMYCIIFVGLIWFMLYSCSEASLLSNPANFTELADMSAELIFLFNYHGQLYGMNMMFLGFGYIITSGLLQYKTFQYYPLSLRQKIIAKQKKRVEASAKNEDGSFASGSSSSKNPMTKDGQFIYF